MSCSTKSWASKNLDEAIDVLAKRASIARTIRKAEKSADYMETVKGLPSVLQRQMQLNPALASTIAGGLGGAAVGGLSSLGADPKRRHTGRNMLTGALAGSGVGFGGYMASRMLPELAAKLKEPSDALGFSMGGEERSLKPDAVSKHPDAIQAANQLKEKSLPTRAIGGSWDFVKNYAKNHPILASIMGMDIGTTALGTSAGMMSNMPGQRPNILREGVSRTKSLTDDLKKELSKWMTSATDDDVVGVLDSARAAGGRGRVGESGLGSMGQHNSPFHGMATSTINDLYNEGGGFVRSGLGNAAQDIGHTVQDYLKRINPQLAETLANKLKPLTNAGSSIAGKFPGASKAMGNMSKLLATRPGATTMLGKLGPRAALYAGVPALQEYLRIAGQESQNDKRLRQLMEQLSGPAGQ